MIDDMYKIFDRIDSLKKRFGMLKKSNQQNSAQTEVVKFSPEIASTSEQDDITAERLNQTKEAENKAAQIRQAAVASVLQTITSSESASSSLQGGLAGNSASLLESVGKAYRDNSDEATPSQIIDTLK